MTDHLMSDIQKHNNKVTRILNKLCQKYPGLTEQIDLALYSCLKIEKIVKKCNEQQKGNGGNKQNHRFSNRNQDLGVNLAQEDQLYSSALGIIEGFKSATKKLQNKVGILLREQQIAKQVERAKHNINTDPYYQIPPYNNNQRSSRNVTAKAKRKYISTYENTSPFSPHVIQNQNSHSKHNKPKHYISSDGKHKNSEKQRKRKMIKEYMNESEGFLQEAEGYRSKNISELDQEIIDLASQIKLAIKKQ